jgi:nucleoside-diphosphate kinase
LVFDAFLRLARAKLNNSSGSQRAKTKDQSPKTKTNTNKIGIPLNMSNLTFGIIKPDAVRAAKTGSILQRILDNGFKIRGLKLIHMTRQQAEGFYDVHRERPFFPGLTEFMSSAPCVVMVLEKNGAVKAWRDLMGATDPAKADEGTLRKEFGASVGENATHGSDSEENAAIEISYFFSKLELV